MEELFIHFFCHGDNNNLLVPLFGSSSSALSLPDGRNKSERCERFMSVLSEEKFQDHARRPGGLRQHSL